ncbi:tetratricopeptide repeat protein [Thermoflavimicrobium dichotomicum]|uniref:Tetratricopeptide repeat-containing protein n=1 Tax=Thermoflavimicrobium dichotomicum TaxID=46223 RepID=A0A1I3PLI4_9BACL|nr:tetratricopeptide repeat protein [Thermoflavimicrobium dichotomicum]SFJ22418.1 Tetratricopeptide repeat-containing protein [Thermoflavimicrobium dichotomicum]
MHLYGMKETLPNLSLFTRFDPDRYYREVATDRAGLERAIRLAKKLLYNIERQPEREENKKVLLFLNSYLGNAYRVLDQPEPAIRYLTIAEKIARQFNNPALLARTLIRLGEAYKYGDQHDKALACFQEVKDLTDCEELYFYHDFALQHIGKCLMELGRYDEALDHFHKALALRKQKEKQELIRSTELALKLAQKLKEQEEMEECVEVEQTRK